MKTGVHLGLGEGYEEALAWCEELMCTTAQIFTHSPRTFAFKPLDPARQQVLLDGWKKLGVHPVVSHASYLINVAATENRKFYGAFGILKNELVYGKAFGCQYVVFHPGKHTNGTREQGIAQIVKALEMLKETFEETGVMLLLETAAGQGTELCASFEEIRQVISALTPGVRKHVGVCIDTCHLFASGHDLSDPDTLIAKMDNTFGVDLVKVVHVNDSKFPFGERKDRHEHVGMGQIGIGVLKKFLSHPKIRKLPMILETPIDDTGGQEMDIAALRSLL